MSRAFQYRKPRGQQHGRLRAGIAAELRATGAPWLQSKPRRCRFIGTPCDCRRGRAKSYATTASFWTNDRSFQSVAYRDPDVLGWCHRTIRLAIPVHQRFVQTRPPVPRPRPAWAWTLTSPEGMTMEAVTYTRAHLMPRNLRCGCSRRDGPRRSCAQHNQRACDWDRRWSAMLRCW